MTSTQAHLCTLLIAAIFSVSTTGHAQLMDDNQIDAAARAASEISDQQVDAPVSGFTETSDERVVTADPQAAPEAAGDYSNEKYEVTFRGWGNRAIVYRDEKGNFMGKSKQSVPLTIVVDGNVIRKATTSKGVDVATVLSQLAPEYDKSGNMYLRMQFNDNTVTAEGVEMSKGRQVLLDLRDFYQDPALLPSGAGEFLNSKREVVDRFNNTQSQIGVTAPTRPVVNGVPVSRLPAPMISLPKTTDDEDELADDPRKFYSPANKDGKQTYGSPFNYKILSSPICDARGRAGITSNVGLRKSRRTRNGGHMSHNHQGMDIGAPYGTPVIAAADGCLKMTWADNACLVRTGKTIPIRCLREGGYGYTVRLVHGNGYETQYSHLSSINPDIRAGACFKRGDVLGGVGQTGSATGNHLHFGVYKDRRMVDPRASLLSTTGAFFNSRCNALPDRTALDSKMARALGGRGVTLGRAPIRSTSSAGRVN